MNHHGEKTDKIKGLIQRLNTVYSLLDKVGNADDKTALEEDYNKGCDMLAELLDLDSSFVIDPNEEYTFRVLCPGRTAGWFEYTKKGVSLNEKEKGLLRATTTKSNTDPKYDNEIQQIIRENGGTFDRR